MNWTAPDPLEGTKFYSIQLEWAWGLHELVQALQPEQAGVNHRDMNYSHDVKKGRKV